jgi:high-affinity iron transporter
METRGTVFAGPQRSRLLWVPLLVSGLLVVAAILWQAIASSGNPNPLVPGTGSLAALFDISILVFREGLECVLVLAAITAGQAASRSSSTSPISVGAVAGFIVTLATWFATLRVVDDLGHDVSALALQAATGLLAVVVLLVVMNWFFHKLYWTGWISLHSKRKRELLDRRNKREKTATGLFLGLALLGFTSVYREGFEVVLFLQSYRLRLGDKTVLWGACMGLVLSGIVAILTFLAHRRLPYRKMLVLTGALLGVVLVVMAGEQAQEMQLAGWISTTTIPSLAHRIPSWMGVWFSVFPTIETLLAQAGAALLVLGSYFVANWRSAARRQSLLDEPEKQVLPETPGSPATKEHRPERHLFA